MLSIIRESIDSGRPKKVRHCHHQSNFMLTGSLHQATSLSSFDILDVISDRFSTKVFLAMKTGSSKQYAVKVTHRKAFPDAQILNYECKILKLAAHAKLRFLPRLFCSFQDEDHLFLVTVRF